MTVDFDEAKHAYSVSGRPLPGVTQTLRDAGMFPTQWDEMGLVEHREVGKLVHKLCEQIVTGKMEADVAAQHAAFLVPSEYWMQRAIGAVTAFGQFVNDTHPELIYSEQRLYSRVYGFAGTIDLVIRMREWTWVIDMKSGSPYPAVELQTAAYRQLVLENVAEGVSPIVRRAALYLRPNGVYKLDEHEDPNDFRVFQAALTANAWRKSRGLLEAA